MLSHNSLSLGSPSLQCGLTGCATRRWRRSATYTVWADRVCDVQVEAKYPALLFKQQLDAFVQKIFPMLRDNVKKEITPQLAACIHAPRAATTRGRRGGMAADVASPRALIPCPPPLQLCT